MVIFIDSRILRAAATILLVFAPVLARPALAETFIAGGRATVQRMTLESGPFELRGGIEVSAPLFSLPFGKNRTSIEKLSYHLLVFASNKSARPVWVEVEVQAAVADDDPKDFEKMKAGERYGFRWKLKKVDWNERYRFTVSVFADEARSKLLASSKTFFSFDEPSAKAALEAYKMDLFTYNGNNTVNGRKDFLLLPGWRDDQAAAEAHDAPLDSTPQKSPAVPDNPLEMDLAIMDGAIPQKWDAQSCDTWQRWPA